MSDLEKLASWLAETGFPFDWHMREVPAPRILIPALIEAHRRRELQLTGDALDHYEMEERLEHSKQPWADSLTRNVVR